jgi:ferric-dicitrate binding protein FerR (iron transport regulator)
MEFVVSRSSASSEATRWLIQLQTSRCIDELWPSFEAWLYQDQDHWNAFMHAQETWRKLDCVKAAFGPRKRPAWAQQLCGATKKEAAVRSRVEFLWIALGTSVVMFLLALM